MGVSREAWKGTDRLSVGTEPRIFRKGIVTLWLTQGPREGPVDLALGERPPSEGDIEAKT